MFEIATAIRLIHEFSITGSIARQPLPMADQACNCWFFFISSYDAYIVDFSASILDTMCFSKILFISLRNFNQLDATSKVMHRHEIICTGNKAYLINKYFFRDNAVAASLWKIRE